METRVEMRAVEVRMKCDVCDISFMSFTGVELTDYPGLFVHKCRKCGHTESYRVTYPYMEYEEVKKVKKSIPSTKKHYKLEDD